MGQTDTSAKRHLHPDRSAQNYLQVCPYKRRIGTMKIFGCNIHVYDMSMYAIRFFSILQSCLISLADPSGLRSYWVCMQMYVGRGVIAARCRWADLSDILPWCQRDHVNNIYICRYMLTCIINHKLKLCLQYFVKILLIA